jgi:hypothetical protein
MNTLQDPTKKTSIVSLLNPDVASVYPQNSVPIQTPAHHSVSVGPGQRRPHTHQTAPLVHSTPPYPEGTSFRLSSASWSGGITHQEVQHHSGRNSYSADRRDGSGYPPIAPRAGVDHGASHSALYRTYGRPRATSIQSMTGIEPVQAWQPQPEPSTSGVSCAGKHLSVGTSDQRHLCNSSPLKWLGTLQSVF